MHKLAAVFFAAALVAVPAQGAHSAEVYESEYGGEQFRSIPISGPGQPRKYYPILMRRIPGLAPGDVIIAQAEFQATSQFGYPVQVTSRISLATDRPIGGTATRPGRRLGGGGGTNVHRDVQHHLQVTRVGTGVVPWGPYEWVTVWIDASSRGAKRGDHLRIDRGLGKLSIVRIPWDG